MSTCASGMYKCQKCPGDVQNIQKNTLSFGKLQFQLALNINWEDLPD